MKRDVGKIEYYLMKFPNRCAEARNAKGLTQQQTADALGMSLTGYQYLEYGERELKSGRLVQLSKLFDCTTDFLIYFDDGELDGEDDES